MGFENTSMNQYFGYSGLPCKGMRLIAVFVGLYHKIILFTALMRPV